MLDLMSFLSGGGHRIKLKRKEYISAGLVVLLVFIALVLFAFEVKHFSNTFQVNAMVQRALLLGGGVGLGISYWLTRNKPDMDLLPKFQLWVAVFIGCVLIMPLLASLTNRYLSFSGSELTPVELVKVEGIYSSRFGMPEGETPKADVYYVFMIKEGQLERIKSKTNPFPNSNEGDFVDLPIRSGFWGYDYVLEKDVIK